MTAQVTPNTGEHRFEIISFRQKSGWEIINAYPTLSDCTSYSVCGMAYIRDTANNQCYAMDGTPLDAEYIKTIETAVAQHVLHERDSVLSLKDSKRHFIDVPAQAQMQDDEDEKEDDEETEMTDEQAYDELEQIASALDRSDDDAGISNEELRALAKRVRACSAAL